MRKDAKLELLRQGALFARCAATGLGGRSTRPEGRGGAPRVAGGTKKERGEISTLADELSLPQGTKLIEEGRQAHEFFLLVDGTVDVSAKGREAERRGPGTLL